MTNRLRTCALAAGLALIAPQAPAESDATESVSAELRTSMWRARTRLERGDILLSRPVYERLYKELRSDGGPALAEVAQGLAICEIARGQAPSAVAPWLDVLNLRQQGVAIAVSESIPPLLDDQTGLAPLLAPIWLAGPELAPLVDEQFQRRYLAPESGQSADIVTLARLYRAAAAFELGLPISPAPSGDAEPAPSSGVPAASIALVQMIVDARIGDESTRSAARGHIQTALVAELEANPGSWREAWLRAGLGRSLLRESDPDAREWGMLELLHLPSRFAESQPRLAALALAEVARELEQRGRLPASESVAALLQGQLADPDALRWLQEPVRLREPSDSPAPDPAQPPKEAQGS